MTNPRGGNTVSWDRVGLVLCLAAGHIGSAQICITGDIDPVNIARSSSGGQYRPGTEFNVGCL